jgi:hypothetical protein
VPTLEVTASSANAVIATSQISQAESIRFLSAPAHAARAPATASLPGASQPEHGETIDIEAALTIQIDDVALGAALVRGLVRDSQGVVILDNRSSASEQRPQVDLQIRLPSPRFDPFFESLTKIGRVRAREVKTRDIGFDLRDTDVLLENLEAARRRYEEILQRANEVKDVLGVEAELERVRTNLDRTRAHLAWLRDRAARATISVRLFSSAQTSSALEPSDATFFPALRASSLLDVREGVAPTAYLGAGLSFRFLRLFGGRADTTTRGVMLDIDVVRACCGSQATRGAYAYSVLVGADYYSGFLGGGGRTWFNPYLGFRLGATDTDRRGDFAGGLVLGLEIFKTERTSLDLQARALGLVGNADGPHAAMLPSLGFSAAF